jgi:hypothetical protein
MGQSTREGGGTTSGGDQAYRRHAASAQQTVQKVNKIYKKDKITSKLSKQQTILILSEISFLLFCNILRKKINMFLLHCNYNIVKYCQISTLVYGEV